MTYLHRLNIVYLAIILLLLGCRNAPQAAPTPTAVGETAVIAPTATPPPTAIELPPTATPIAEAEENRAVVRYGYRVLNSYPHDPAAFTQGLIYVDGVLYEGTGLRGQSTLRRVALETGEVQQRIDIAPELFGEGITLFGERLFQITWQGQIGFVYNVETFELLESVSYETEGWGITHDGERLIMSDGTANIYFRDPETFAEIGRIFVQENGQPVRRLNELEYINGEIYANVWQTNDIVRIDPETGSVVGRIDLTGLLSPEEQALLVDPSNDVLNGIAYDVANGRLFVTGKRWPKLFEIELVPQP